MKIGFNEATARDCSTLEQDIELCQAAGFEALEIRIDMLEAFLRTRPREALLRRFAQSSVRPVNLNAIYPYEALFSKEDDAARRKAFLDDFRRACDMARYLNANALIVCPPLKADRRTPFLEGDSILHEMNVRILARLSKIAAETETKICFEIVGAPYSACRNVKQAKAVLEAVGAPNLGLAIDAYNLFMERQDAAFSEITLLKARDIFIAHINDAESLAACQKGDQSGRCFCGAGILDLSAYLARLREIGYDGVLSIETFRPEYWQMPAKRVIDEAYRTTRAQMDKSAAI